MTWSESRSLSLQPLDRPRTPPLAVADVDRDPRADLLGQRVVGERRLLGRELRPAQRHRQRHQLVLAGEVLVAQALDVVGMRDRARQVRPLLVARAVGEDGARAGVLEALDRGVGVGRRGEVVGPVEQRRDPRVERLGGAQEVADVGVLGAEVLGEARVDPHQVVTEGPVGGEEPQRRLPGVPVGVDEARHRDRVGHRDALRVGDAEVGADVDDLAVLDQDLPRFKHARDPGPWSVRFQLRSAVAQPKFPPFPRPTLTT